MVNHCARNSGGPGRIRPWAAATCRRHFAGRSLRPRASLLLPFESRFSGGPGRIRTYEGARPADLQSAAFDHFATDPCCQFPLEKPGAVDRNRTGDLLLTMEMLYQLSYNGVCVLSYPLLTVTYRTLCRKRLLARIYDSVLFVLDSELFVNCCSSISAIRARQSAIFPFSGLTDSIRATASSANCFFPVLIQIST